MKRKRQMRAVLRAEFGFLLVLSLFQALPSRAATPEPTPLYDGVDVSEIPVKGQAVEAPPVTDADRIPVPAPVDTNGLMDPEFVKVDPGSGDSLEQLLGDEISDPKAGGAEFDAYAPAPDIGTHFIAVYPEIRNELSADGRWVALPDEFAVAPNGWEIAGETFAIRLPVALAADAPIVTESGDASISIVPDGVLPVPGALVDGLLVYAGALPSTDLIYTPLPGGYEESVVLLTPIASSAVAWTVEAKGFSLQLAEDGRIEVLDEGGTRYEMSAPTVFDAKGDLFEASYALKDLGEGSYRIELILDPAALATATYPVTIDPGTHQPILQNDTYAQSNQATTTHGTLNPLITGPWTGTGARYRTFMRFGTDWQSTNMVIYSAELHIKNTSEPNGATDLLIDRATWDWSNALTWNSMMAQPGEGVSDTPAIPDQGGPTNGWWTVELKKLYQPYVEGTYPDYGFRLVSSDNKKFNSQDASGTTNDPYLVVSYDTLPNPPTGAEPSGTPVFESLGGNTLRIDGIPNDPDGDEVLVRYQVTNTNGQWGCSGNGEYCSGWVDDPSFTIPSAWLKDGGTFYWRVQSGDVCVQPATLCDATRPDGTVKPWRDTTVHSFTMSLKNRGVDSRYAMWKQSLGNGMRLAINEANGNMVLQVPIASPRTVLGRIRVGLSYNSHAAADGTDRGLGAGWRLWAGPESSGTKVPIEVSKPAPWPYAGAKITFQSGNNVTLPWRAGHVFGNLGVGEGVLRENGDGTFVYRTGDGDVYTFEANGDLKKARTVSTKPKTSLATNPNYRYTFNGNGHLTSVTDPKDRAINFDWQLENGVERLKTITTWSGDNWNLFYTSGGRLERVKNPIPAPDSENVFFNYDTFNGVAGLISQVKNGHHYEQAQPGWRFEHFLDTAPAAAFQVVRVKKIAPPGASLTDNFWKFTYGSGVNDYIGYTSKTTKVTDPRGVGQTANFTSVVDFNETGFPIQLVAPKTAAGDSSWTTRMVWDTNNQLLCRRAPASNTAASSTECTAGNITGAESELWSYDGEAPYRLQEYLHATPSGTERVKETYSYDQGGSFTGLWEERFENADLAGVPTWEGSVFNFERSWGATAPTGIDDPDSWSVRLSGMVFPDVNETYEFKVDGDDGYSLVIDNKVLLNCLYDTNPGVNCGQANPPQKKFFDPDHRITIEYRDQSSTNAHLQVYWRKKPNTNWIVLPEAKTSPDLGLLTDKTVGPEGGGALTLTYEWTFVNDDFKATRLPKEYRITDQTTGHKQWTTYTYDDWGRKETVTRYTTAPTGEQATWTYGYTDNLSKSCLTSVTGPEGQERTFNCNPDGERIEKTIIVDQVSIGGTVVQPAQTRTTTITRDDVGRVKRKDYPGNGAATTTYDKSGRVIQTRVLLRGDGTAGTDWAVTTYSYLDWPAAGAFRQMTETLPDPDPFSSSVGPAQVTHTYDWVGNETSRTDVRDPSVLWLTGYDAQNRVISTTSPDPDGGQSLVPLTTSTTYNLTTSDFSTVSTDPAGVTSRTWFDALGRPIQSKSGGLASTWTQYDTVGNVTKVQTSVNPIGGGGEISWRENDYDAFGKPIAMREPALVNGTPTPQTTTYTYNPDTLRLASVNGPLPPSEEALRKDVVDYTWDRSGRLTTVNMWTKTGEAFLTTVTYDDAGEQVRIASELAADGSKMQIRDFSYTARGLLDKTTEYHGNVGSVTGAKIFDNSYDLAGRLVSIDSPRWGQNPDLRFVYDDLGRETARYRDTGSGQADRIDTTYLADGLISTASRVAGATYTFGYDALGRQTSLTEGTNATGWTYFGTSAEGAKAGWLKSLSTPAGTTSYTYYSIGESGGSGGLLKTLTDPLTSSATTYAYDAGGRVVTRTDPGGLSWTRTYESETGRIDTQKIAQTGSNPLKTFAWFDIGYDVAGNVKSRVEKLWRLGTTNANPGSVAGDTGTGSWSYDYDGAGRMVQANGPNAAGVATTWSYQYDGQGNRLVEQIGSVTETYVTDDQGWPISMDSSASGPGTDTTFTFDTEGDLLSLEASGTADDLAFVYDSWGDTDAATAGSVSIDYSLDAFGRTTSRTQGATTTTFSYEGGSENLASTTSAGTTTRYAYSPGGPLAAKAGALSAEFFLKDAHADIVGAIASGSATLASTSWYSPFGEGAPLFGTPSALGYQGDWTDEATGAVDMLTRSYLPSLGRFTTRDILGGDPADPPSLNQYVYATGSPVTYADPTGMYQDDGGGGIGYDPPLCDSDTSCGGNGDMGPGGGSGPGGGGSNPGGGGSGSQDGTTAGSIPEVPERSSYDDIVKALFTCFGVSGAGADDKQTIGGGCSAQAQGPVGNCPPGAYSTIAGGVIFWHRCWAVGSAPMDFDFFPVGDNGSDEGGGPNRYLDDLALRGRGGSYSRGGAIGFAPGEGVSALPDNRLQHGTKNLTEAGLLPPYRGRTSPALIRSKLVPILENPLATFNAKSGPFRTRGFLGEIDGVKVAVLVFKEGQYRGLLASSYLPTAGQYAKWGI